MGIRVHVRAAKFKLGSKLTDQTCPEAYSHLPHYVKLFHTASQHSDCSLFQGLSWLMSMSLMVQGEKQQSSQDYYTLTEVSVYTLAMWPVLKSLIQCTVNITLIPLFHLNVSSQCSIETSDVHRVPAQDLAWQTRDEWWVGGVVGYKFDCMANVCIFLTLQWK